MSHNHANGTGEAKCPVLTTANGAPIGVQQALTAGPRGPVLMQFADTDEHVSTARREQLAAAAPKGADVRLYKAGHELSEDSTRERLAWLRRTLRLGS